MVTSEDRWRTNAIQCVSASRRHMAMSVVLCSSGLIWYALQSSSLSSCVFMIAVMALLVAYNAVRIRGARRALRDPSRLGQFYERQVRSHRVRGRVYLVAAPIIVITTWTGIALSREHVPLDAWMILIATTIGLVYGWLVWRRALKRAPFHRPPQAPDREAAG